MPIRNRLAELHPEITACHHPAYDFDDDAIPVGCSWFATLAERRMPLQQEP